MTTPHHDELTAAHAALDDLDVPAMLDGERLPLAERIAWLNLTRPTDGGRPAAALRDVESGRKRVLGAASVWARATNALPLGVEADAERDALLAAVAALERPAEARPRFVPPATIGAEAGNDAAGRVPGVLEK
ncbi:MAG TPA: hypothetical protein VOB72_05435 [Candidatus Dormibacteraeota bacterium]|nr:hypothetical protein [Candidatus Dormibacteraeota bacterium]